MVMGRPGPIEQILRIISQFNGAGIQQGTQQLKQLEREINRLSQAGTHNLERLNASFRVNQQTGRTSLRSISVGIGDLTKELMKNERAALRAEAMLKRTEMQMNRGGRAAGSFARGLRTAQIGISELGRGADRTGVSIARLVTAGVSAQAAYLGLSRVMSAVTGTVLGFNDSMQRAAVGFDSFTKNSEVTQQLLAAIQQFAIDTPYRLEGLVKYTTRFLAAGVQVGDIIPIWERLGNAIAATGDISQVQTERVVRAFTQMLTRGRVATQEMNQLR